MIGNEDLSDDVSKFILFRGCLERGVNDYGKLVFGIY